MQKEYFVQNPFLNWFLKAVFIINMHTGEMQVGHVQYVIVIYMFVILPEPSLLHIITKICI